MKIARILAAASMFTVMGFAAPAGSACASCQTTEYLTCHECCQIKCHQLYPGNPGMQQRCTWSCIDQDCGGGPFP